MLSDKNGFFADETGFYRLTVSKYLDFILEVKIFHGTCKELTNITFDHNIKTGAKSGIMLGFNHGTVQSRNIIAIKYKLEGKNQVIERNPVQVNGEIYTELRLIKFEKISTLQNFGSLRIRKGANDNILYFLDDKNCIKVEIKKEIFNEMDFKEAILESFKEENITKIRWYSKYGRMWPFGDNFLIFYDSIGSYTITDANNQKNQKSAVFDEIQNSDENISLLKFSKNQEYLIIITAIKDSICRIIVYKVNHPTSNERKLPELTLLHKHPLCDLGVKFEKIKGSCIFNSITCDAKIRDKYLLILYQRNYPYQKVVFMLNDKRISNLVGVTTHIGKWKSGFFVKRNYTCGTVLGNEVGAKGTGVRPPNESSVVDSGDRMWILKGSYLSVVGFEEEDTVKFDRISN